MSLMDNLKNIHSDLAEAIRRVEESGETVKFKKTFGGQAKRFGNDQRATSRCKFI